LRAARSIRFSRSAQARSERVGEIGWRRCAGRFVVRPHHEHDEVALFGSDRGSAMMN
jgi:hypothetical protein